MTFVIESIIFSSVSKCPTYFQVADLVLFTENIPTKALLQQITKVTNNVIHDIKQLFQLLPECIDKSLNFGVELIEETIRMSGEFLNEKIEINIRLASEKLLETDVPNGEFFSVM